MSARAGMKLFWVAFLLTLVAGCARFRRLREDLRFMEQSYTVTAVVDNPDQLPDVYGAVVEWEDGAVHAADFCQVGEVGLFGFRVYSAENQYLLAFSDRNGNGLYDAAEPSWIHTGPDGKPAAVRVDEHQQRSRMRGRLSADEQLPVELVRAAYDFIGARTARDAATGLNIPIALGDIADLDDSKFEAARGSDGLWEPARFPLDVGIGIYFLEPYDPDKIPVLFVNGAAGSPQDWRIFFDEIDRDTYQPWFYLFPSGQALDQLATSLNYAVTVLQSYYGFEQLHVVAHSMGGLMSRGFLIKNVLEDGNRYIDTFVSITTPWGGHEAAAMGVKTSPGVVPSWRDMQMGSDYQYAIFSRSLRHRVDSLLIYGFKSSRSFFLPKENDGTVSVRSQTTPAALSEADLVIGYDLDHVGILSDPDVIRDVEAFLGGDLRSAGKP